MRDKKGNMKERSKGKGERKYKKRRGESVHNGRRMRKGRKKGLKERCKSEEDRRR